MAIPDDGACGASPFASEVSAKQADVAGMRHASAPYPFKYHTIHPTLPPLPTDFVKFQNVAQGNEAFAWLDMCCTRWLRRVLCSPYAHLIWRQT